MMRDWLFFTAPIHISQPGNKVLFALTISAGIIKPLLYISLTFCKDILQTLIGSFQIYVCNKFFKKRER